MTASDEPGRAAFRDALLATLLPDPGVSTSEEDERWWALMQAGLPFDIGEMSYANAERLVSRAWAWKRATDLLWPWWATHWSRNAPFTFRNAMKVAPPEVVAEVVEALFAGGFTEAELGIERPPRTEAPDAGP
ncbi:hypothetical protein N865_19680 [Intrasporangium oryzae NRRL B-24470]|uniref:Uncharacterized protein n=1 Tax=Intrasporangium oryzae NRRL B-24470 TaxID=1386089 RepID=W9G3Q9_9MICO|nr:hypothetical protein [Intrasporangium oryzae]EWS99941.1 hypothetical protein N865_19680 [Intrasporangium oryzae NRRL B-24470]